MASKRISHAKKVKRNKKARIARRAHARAHVHGPVHAETRKPARRHAPRMKGVAVHGAHARNGAGRPRTEETTLRTRSGRVSPVIASPDEVKSAVVELLGNDNAVAFLRKNVSKWAPDVLNMLAAPKTDEYLAEQLGMKINAIRRILNLLQGYGITNYYVAKNTNGWLSFAWYVNTSKIPPFFEYVNSVSNKKTVISMECNDYFMCNACYQKDKLIFTFDAAYEAAFRCSCGHEFTRIGREAAERLVEDEAKSASARADVV